MEALLLSVRRDWNWMLQNITVLGFFFCSCNHTFVDSVESFGIFFLLVSSWSVQPIEKNFEWMNFYFLNRFTSRGKFLCGKRVKFLQSFLTSLCFLSFSHVVITILRLNGHLLNLSCSFFDISRGGKVWRMSWITKKKL